MLNRWTLFRLIMELLLLRKNLTLNKFSFLLMWTVNFVLIAKLHVSAIIMAKIARSYINQLPVFHELLIRIDHQVDLPEQRSKTLRTKRDNNPPQIGSP